MCACNRILGLGDVHDRDIDARQYDAPPPSLRCPPVGAGVPAYRDSIHQVFGVELCSQYIRAQDGSGMGRCLDSLSSYSPQAAQPGQKLMPIVFIGDAGYSIEQTRLGLAGGFAVFTTTYNDAEV